VGEKGKKKREKKARPVLHTPKVQAPLYIGKSRTLKRVSGLQDENVVQTSGRTAEKEAQREEGGVQVGSAVKLRPHTRSNGSGEIKKFPIHTQWAKVTNGGAGREPKQRVTACLDSVHAGLKSSQ